MGRFDVCVGQSAEAGFAYIWVLLLIAFLGLSLSAAVEIDATNSLRERERELLSIGRQFRTAIGSYYEAQLTAGRREYPTELADLLQDKRLPGIKRHLRKIFVDPVTAKSEWGLVIIGGRIVGVHSLSDKEPIKQDGFEAENVSLRGKKKYSEWVFTYPADMVMQLEAGGSLKHLNPGLPFNGQARDPTKPGQNSLGVVTSPPPRSRSAERETPFGNRFKEP